METVLHHFVEDYQGGGEGVIGTAGKTKEQVGVAISYMQYGLLWTLEIVKLSYF